MIRAYIHEDIAALGIDVTIVMHPPEGSLEPRHRILRLADGDPWRSGWEPAEPGTPDVKPTLRLGAEEARALLDALTVHFHGAEDTRALRRDYDAERGRVDRLIGHLAKVTEHLTAPEPPAPEPVRLEARRSAGKVTVTNGDSGWPVP